MSLSSAVPTSRSTSSLKAAGIDMTKEKPALLTISVTEDEIRGIGGENIVGAYAAMKYFQSLPNENNTSFVKAFKEIVGPRISSSAT